MACILECIYIASYRASHKTDMNNSRTKNTLDGGEAAMQLNTNLCV